ncbi:CAA30371.1 protein [Striga asiatica]|uniref:CAA30371.1 protein n=1 Tax=Striga asiatica TaxID=4170 RepID=A0A5A7PYL4_STRAF|nr:CAA30371.1 protein [Striga asiatica]
MNEGREDQIWCYFHPREIVIGICASCLKERLLVLASKQKQHHHHHVHHIHTPKRAHPKIFALSSLIDPLDVMHHKKSDDHALDDYSSSTSHEDSFISIRFEDNQVASWDKGKTSKLPNENNQIRHPQQNDHNTLNKAHKIKSVVEHRKTRTTLRWRKPIGHLLQLIRWRRKDFSHACMKIDVSMIIQSAAKNDVGCRQRTGNSVTARFSKLDNCDGCSSMGLSSEFEDSWQRL